MWLKKNTPQIKSVCFFCMLWSDGSPRASCVVPASLHFFFSTTVEFILNMFFFFRAVCQCTAAAYILSCFDGTDTADTSAGSTALQ